MGKELYSPNSGDVISGWTVNSVHIKPVNIKDQVQALLEDPGELSP